MGTRKTRDGLARYGIVARHAVGVPMGALLKLSKQLGTDHELSLALWDSGIYEARLLASLVGDAERVTRRQMDAWAAGFENWGDCDTVCFKLFDRSPHAWKAAPKWAASPREFVRRGGFALMACLALHDKSAPDKPFHAFLELLEQGARDERDFVKKSVSLALRAIGRRSRVLNDEATAVATRLAASRDAASRWVGRDALRRAEKTRSCARSSPAGEAERCRAAARPLAGEVSGARPSTPERWSPGREGVLEPRAVPREQLAVHETAAWCERPEFRHMLLLERVRLARQQQHVGIRDMQLVQRELRIALGACGADVLAAGLREQRVDEGVGIDRHPRLAPDEVRVAEARQRRGSVGSGGGPVRMQRCLRAVPGVRADAR